MTEDPIASVNDSSYPMNYLLSYVGTQKTLEKDLQNFSVPDCLNPRGDYPVVSRDSPPDVPEQFTV